jgi:hypothetical protein
MFLLLLECVCKVVRFMRSVNLRHYSRKSTRNASNSWGKWYRNKECVFSCWMRSSIWEELFTLHSFSEVKRLILHFTEKLWNVWQTDRQTDRLSDGKDRRNCWMFGWSMTTRTAAPASLFISSLWRMKADSHLTIRHRHDRKIITRSHVPTEQRTPSLKCFLNCFF